MFAAEAQVRTDKAQRYLKALCNHFSHKVTAEYDGNRGNVKFGFGDCQMEADASQLVFRIQAEDAEGFERLKYVISDHLERFSGEDALQVAWVERTA